MFAAPRDRLSESVSSPRVVHVGADVKHYHQAKYEESPSALSRHGGCLILRIISKTPANLRPLMSAAFSIHPCAPSFGCHQSRGIVLGVSVPEPFKPDFIRAKGRRVARPLRCPPGAPLSPVALAAGRLFPPSSARRSAAVLLPSRLPGASLSGWSLGCTPASTSPRRCSRRGLAYDGISRTRHIVARLTRAPARGRAVGGSKGGPTFSRLSSAPGGAVLTRKSKFGVIPNG